jgi:hypothetical protein
VLLLLQTAQRMAEQQNQLGYSFRMSVKRGILAWGENVNFKFARAEYFKKFFGPLESEVRMRLSAAYYAHPIA